MVIDEKKFREQNRDIFIPEWSKVLFEYAELPAYLRRLAIFKQKNDK